MSKYPIIKITIFFALGILFQSQLVLNTHYYLITILISFSIIILSLLLSRNLLARSVRKVLFAIIIILSGAFYYTFSIQTVSYPFDLPKIKNAKIVAHVNTIELITNNKLTLEIYAREINDSITMDKNANKFVLNIWEDSLFTVNNIYKQIKIGNTISLIGTISKAKNDRNPGEFNYEKYLNNKGIVGLINCYKPEQLEIVDNTNSNLRNIVFSIRKKIDESIKKNHSKTAAALLKGILLADRKDLDYDIRTTFVNSGVIHVLAVSGLHVGFIIGIFFLLFGRFNIRLKYILTIVGIVIFLVITGGHSSVFRASTMAIIFLIARLSARSTNGYNSISIAAFLLLLLDPNELFNPGFQLSFSAVLSILIIYPIFSEKIYRLKINALSKNLLLFISVSIAAQLGTLPFTLIYFHKLSIISIFANLIVIPIIGVIVALGVTTLILSFFLPVASVFASANMILIEAMFYFVNYTSSLTFSYIPIYNFSLVDGIFFYFFLIIIIYSIYKYNNKVLLILTILLTIISFSNYLYLDNEEILPKNNLSIVAIDVGQGDAILIKFPNDKIALIDAGNSTEYFDNGERVIYPLLQKLEIDKINTAFISHMDSDHFAGIISLVEKNIIDTIYKPCDKFSIKDNIFEEFVEANNIYLKHYSEGSFEIGGAKVFFLNDTSSMTYKQFDSNNKSGIIKICYGNNSFLFVGDAEIEAEEYLVNLYDRFLNADVLKIGHHGSSTSSSEEFVELVNPKIGIISAGVMNKFNHPSKKIVNLYNERNVKLFRTDYEGAIIFTSDGEEISKIDWRE